MRIEALSGWTSEQRHVVAACFLGWTLDAFDFFLLVFVLKDIAQEFNTQIRGPRRRTRSHSLLAGS
jgi:SHS family lactate transporter-like MFS transporter